jgi:hypothetical protein
MPVEAVSKSYEVVKSQSKLASILQWGSHNDIAWGSLALPAWPLFRNNPVKNLRKLLTRWPVWDDLLSDLLSTLRPSRHIIGFAMENLGIQECIDYTTRSFTHSIISYRGFNDASIHVLPYALSSPRTNRGPAADLPRLPSSDTPWDVYQRCRPHAVRSTYPMAIKGID